MLEKTSDEISPPQPALSGHANPDRPRLRRKDVPAYLVEKFGIDVAVGTLNKLASIGGGPAMQYAGRIPLYPKDELDRWAERRLGKVVASTSEKEAIHADA